MFDLSLRHQKDLGAGGSEWPLIVHGPGSSVWGQL